MPWMPAAIAGGAIISGAMGANAAGKAASGQAQATAAATAEQARQFDLARADQLPFLQTGQGANIKLRQLLGIGGVAGVDETDPRFLAIKQRIIDENDAAHRAAYGMSIFDARSGLQAPGERERFDANVLSGAKQQFLAKYGDEGATSPGAGVLLKDFTPGDLTSEPGYQFGLTQGNKAIENAARARGMYMSPSTVKELLRYGQDYAGTKYQDAYNRDLTNRTTKFNILSGASGGGQVAANTLSNAGQNYATNVGNLVTAGANARGAAGIAGANAWNNAFSTIGNTYMQNSYLNRILDAGDPYRNMPSGYGLR